MDSSWRTELLSKLENLFDKEDKAHGLLHALKVEERVNQIVEESNFDTTETDLLVIQAAALLHDTGYSGNQKDWSPGKIEHVTRSISIASDLLSRLKPFVSNPKLIDLVNFMILHHDDTNYSVPILSNGVGRVWKYHMDDTDILALNRVASEHPSAQLLLKILKQADSQEGLSIHGAQRTWDYSISRGLREFAPGNPTGSLAWEDSAITNVRLAAKRGLLDSFSDAGRKFAVDAYKDTEHFIRQIYGEKLNNEYEPEPLIEALGIDIVRNIGISVKSIEEYRNWDSLLPLLKGIPLKGDANIYPYAEAAIESVLIPISDLIPLAKYAIKKKVEFQAKIAQDLIINYGFDLFNLSGMIAFEANNKISIAPPVVEAYIDDSSQKVYALVDGMHRCLAASQLGLSKVRVILISNVPDAVPLCPMPVRWEEVKLVEKVPQQEDKRNYRFDSVEEFTKFANLTNTYKKSVMPKTKDEARYFTYRNLSPIGSQGPRDEE